jgi:hypothetical protein
MSDLPTTHLPGARVSSAPVPSPAQDVSDLPTQRVKATLPPATASAPPASTPSRSAVRPRARIVVVAATIVALLVVVSAALALTTLRPAVATTNAAYRQPLTAVAEGWPNSGACRFTASGYEVSGPSVCFYGGQDVRDATISVTMTRTSEGNEPSAGLAFRRTGAAAFYTFELDGNGDWAVYKRGTVLQQGDNDAIKTDQGAKNTLRVQMKGGHFTFAVNGAQMAQLDDAEFATGEVGLTGYTGLKVVYTDLTIAPLS